MNLIEVRCQVPENVKVVENTEIQLLRIPKSNWKMSLRLWNNMTRCQPSFLFLLY